ncbi:MAG: deoxyribonuclease V [Phycisphaerales bacterium]|nr:deoxyribonuclease V [Phycisphaerales bacterium]
MRIAPAPHSWDATPTEAVAIQRRLADRVIREGDVDAVRIVAGADLAFTRNGRHAIAGVVAWDVSQQRVVERVFARRKLTFPYVPGLLSFREMPALLAALRKLKTRPDVFMFDGQGYAHPRRFGLACHAGVLLDRPSLGCAKSVLVGTFDPPRKSAGATSMLLDGDEPIGAAVRTRAGVKPVFVSVGHRLSLDAAVQITLATCTRYRLPEPTRLADLLVDKLKHSL